MTYLYQPETERIFKKFELSFKDNQPCLQAHRRGKMECEPLYIMADCLIRYAKAFVKNDSKVCRCSFTEPLFKQMAYAVIQFGNLNGAASMENGWMTDSKDNAVICHLIEKACEIAGIDYEELSL